MVEEIQKNLQEEIEKFKQVQKDYHKTLSRRQQLDSQMNENLSVKEEFSLLKAANEVFKLIGPVLVKQDLEEARENVNKRIEYIKNEIKRVEESIIKLDEKQQVHKENLDKLQKSFQQSQANNQVKTMTESVRST